MQMDKKYIEENLGLVRMVGLSGEKIYTFESFGFFGRVSDTNIWCFIPYNNPRAISSREEFERLYL